MSMTGAQIVWKCLEAEGVSTVFGYPGGAVLPLYDALRTSTVHHVLVRHEQGATHMADGYARASGRVGVALATSGPGATNMVTGLATAMLDSSPVICITGQVSSSLLGTDAFQEVDIVGITMPVTKHSMLVSSVRGIATSVRQAFQIARSGRPGPVLIDITKDAMQGESDQNCIELQLHAKTPANAGAGELMHAAELIGQAKRPLILAGQGVLAASACDELLALAEIIEAPVALTLLGMGAFPVCHRLYLGMMGMHGDAWVNEAIQCADVLVALGMRFDDRVTGRLNDYAPEARKIHIDIDPAELNKNVVVDVGITADLKLALIALLAQVDRAAHPDWMQTLARFRANGDGDQLTLAEARERCHPAAIVREISRATCGDALLVTDVGQHQMWAARHYRHRQPRSFITSGGLGAMGFGLPAAIGAQLACRDREVWLVVGDGGLQMTMAELATAVQEQTPVRIALINNGCLGMIRQWQEFFYEKNYSNNALLSPDFCTVAQAYGIWSERVCHAKDVASAIQRARSQPGPALIDFHVEPEASVYPFVPPGAALHEMIRNKNCRK